MCKLTEINSAKQIEAIPEQALAWHQEGRGAVLATVIQTWGSAPRRIGGTKRAFSEAMIMSQPSAMSIP